MSFTDRDKCAVFARAIKDALAQKAMLKFDAARAAFLLL